MKTVLITGASSGIGKALALTYAQMGYRVIACGRDQQRLHQLSKQNSHIDTYAFDITCREDVAIMAEQAPNVDIAIFNAGSCEYINDVNKFDSKLFERIIHNNLTATGYLVEYWFPKINTLGTMAFVSSSATLLPLPRAQAYGASKAGLDYLAKSLAVDAKANKINISLIAPGFVSTPLTQKNNFPMPFIVTAQQAADKIIAGINKGKSTIYFPKRLIWLMKLFSFLPSKCWIYLAQFLKKDT